MDTSDGLVDGLKANLLEGLAKAIQTTKQGMLDDFRRIGAISDKKEGTIWGISPQSSDCSGSSPPSHGGESKSIE